jgi:hypothetical protein
MKHLSKHIIVGVHITDRVEHVSKVQHLFTEYGCWIRTRLGLHESNAEYCSPNGMILLEMIDNDAKCDQLSAALNAIEGVEAKTMVFDHP